MNDREHKLHDRVKLLHDVDHGDVVVPAGDVGTIVDIVVSSGYALLELDRDSAIVSAPLAELEALHPAVTNAAGDWFRELDDVVLLRDVDADEVESPGPVCCAVNGYPAGLAATIVLVYSNGGLCLEMPDGGLVSLSVDDIAPAAPVLLPSNLLARSRELVADISVDPGDAIEGDVTL